MLGIRRRSTNRWWHKKKNWILFAIFLFLAFVRISKGSFYKDFYYFISKPFWPGQFQKEIVLESIDQEYLIKLNLLKKDNLRLRQIISLQRSSNNKNISAAVISRKTGSFTHIAENPLLCVVNGCGEVLDDFKKLKRVVDTPEFIRNAIRD